MSNQIITNYCSAHCDFCFASDYQSKARFEAREMSPEKFRDYLRFASGGECPELRLLGGEPTLHPFFPQFVREGREAGLRITVFSNGIMPEAALSALADLPAVDCIIIINMNAAATDRQKTVREQTLRVLADRAVPGITLTNAAFSLDPLTDEIEKYGLRRTIRIGIAHPTLTGGNNSLSPKSYARVGKRLIREAEKTHAHGIELDLDCGFVRCMFPVTPDEMQELGIRFCSNCSPILDLCINGDILPCFALGEFGKVRFDPDRNYDETYELIRKRLQPCHSIGVYPECTECPFFETETCCGGCLAARLRRGRNLPEAEA